MQLWFLLLHYCMGFHDMDKLFVHFSIDRFVFQPEKMMTKTTCRYLDNVLWCTQRCSALGYLLQVEMLGPQLTSVSAVLQSEGSNRRTPQHSMRVPSSSHAHQSLVVNLVLILTILMNVQWCLTQVLLQIPQMTNESTFSYVPLYIFLVK